MDLHRVAPRCICWQSRRTAGRLWCMRHCGTARLNADQEVRQVHKNSKIAVHIMHNGLCPCSTTVRYIEHISPLVISLSSDIIPEWYCVPQSTLDHSIWPQVKWGWRSTGPARPAASQQGRRIQNTCLKLATHTNRRLTRRQRVNPSMMTEWLRLAILSSVVEWMGRGQINLLVHVAELKENQKHV